MSATPRLLLTGVYGVALVLSMAAIALVEDDGRLAFVVSYSRWLRIGAVVLWGWLVVGSLAKAVFALNQERAPDAAGALRVVVRLAGYGLMLSLVVSFLTDSSAAALTLGSFAGLVAGFASQAVMGNTVAGLFLSIARPVKVGDTVTIASIKGTVQDITLMHIVLKTADSQILLPTSQVIGAIISKHQPDDGAQ